MKQISMGAEAIIYDTNTSIIKDRIKKNYRVEKLDLQLRKFRTKREGKVLDKLQKLNFRSPKLIKISETILEIEKINGPNLKEVLEDKDYILISNEIGILLSTLHNNGIIHGDLTTSNMILNNDDNLIYFIDFGLSFFSIKIEDMAVDLHLLKRALDSKHYKIADVCFNKIIETYKKHIKYDKVIEKFKEVEKRGRNKEKV